MYRVRLYYNYESIDEYYCVKTLLNKIGVLTKGIFCDMTKKLEIEPDTIGIVFITYNFMNSNLQYINLNYTLLVKTDSRLDCSLIEHLSFKKDTDFYTHLVQNLIDLFRTFDVTLVSNAGQIDKVIEILYSNTITEQIHLLTQLKPCNYIKFLILRLKYEYALVKEDFYDTNELLKDAYKLLSTNPDNIQVLYLVACMEYNLKGNPERAFNVLCDFPNEEVYTMVREDVDILCFLGNMLIQAQRSYRLAYPYFNLITKTKEFSPLGYFYMGLCLEKLNYGFDAIQNYKKAFNLLEPLYDNGILDENSASTMYKCACKLKQVGHFFDFSDSTRLGIICKQLA